MFCHQCGTQVHDGAAFCHSCGAKLQNGAQAQNGTQQQPQAQPTQPQQTSDFAQQAGDAVKNGVDSLARGFNTLKTNVENSQAFKNAEAGVAKAANSQQFGDLIQRINFNLVGIILAAIMAVSYFLPLYSVNLGNYFGSISISMLNLTFGKDFSLGEMKGHILFLALLAFPVAALLCILLLKKPKVAWIITLVLSVLSLIFVAAIHGSLSDQLGGSSYSNYIKADAGFWLYLLCAIALIVLSVLALIAMLRGKNTAQSTAQYGQTAAAQQYPTATPQSSYVFGAPQQHASQQYPTATSQQQFTVPPPQRFNAPVQPTYPTVAPQQPDQPTDQQSTDHTDAAAE